MRRAADVRQHGGSTLVGRQASDCSRWGELVLPTPSGHRTNQTDCPEAVTRQCSLFKASPMKRVILSGILRQERGLGRGTAAKPSRDCSVALAIQELHHELRDGSATDLFQRAGLRAGHSGPPATHVQNRARRR